MQTAIDWLVQTVGAIGYPGIFLLMVLESSLFPVPSEVVLIPAGYLAFQGSMNAYAVVLVGTAGSLVGALLSYFLALYLGRPILLKIGRYFFFRPETLDKMEQYFAKHGEISTFNGRLLPGVRHLISLPAGLAHMDVVKFSLYTLLGAGIWNSILTALGFLLGSQQDLLRENLHKISLGALGFVVVSSLIYVLCKRRSAVSAKRKQTD
ncbi:MAG TPA: DedA family protein [Gammaproteobacteria bacterium]|nr:DedA family protein [Gammaproteobacteria bacterium]